ncbi:winged helix-turn-helix domain-containing protein [Chitinophaga cymbidii]|uniref:ModE family transcriptional regulator n=1 Tax=Chitinophaga cymbidii TaxID=1096750 RepID=A0A512RRT5_9BACT|nr:winged helix-turn-helix domain-containing protein [Chitinophaga cymbidii]GEP98407.1 ModE family transcriptional regulator [Chitinophaga cymbidii]
MKKQHTFKANGRIWIDGPDGAFLGYGRVELLEKIHELGSIRKAALAMKMSYRQAWEFVQQMNQVLKKPLVVANTGGKGGGQAVLTEEGLKAVEQFREFNGAFQEFLASYSKELTFKPSSK